MIGRWIRARGRRDEVLLLTKVGMEMGDGSKGLSKAHILRSLDGSLTRLQTDRVDLYQSHQDDPTVSLVEPLATYAGLIQSGRVRAIGASNYSAARLEEALTVSRSNGLPAYKTLQPRYNLLDRHEFEGSVEGVCRSQGLGVMTYSSLASGFLSGKYRSEADAAKSARGKRGVSRLDERGRRILAALDDVAKSHQTTPAAVAIAWLLTRSSVTAPIASATSVAQLQELIEGTELRLGSDATGQLDDASRYP